MNDMSIDQAASTAAPNVSQDHQADGLKPVSGSPKANPEKAQKPSKLDSNGRAEVVLRMPEGHLSKSSIWVESDNFYCAPTTKKGASKAEKAASKADKPFLMIGFDTEFKTPDASVSMDQVRAGEAKYTVLSYQVHCKLFDPLQPDAIEWSAIYYPQNGDRISMADLIILDGLFGLRRISASLYRVEHQR